MFAKHRSDAQCDAAWRHHQGAVLGGLAKSLWRLLTVACFAIPEGFLMLWLRPPSFRANFPLRLLLAMTKCLE